MIRTMAVVGTGLIGTSVALAAGRHGVAVHLMDRDPAAARTAAALGAGTVGAPAEAADLAVIAVPPSMVGAVLAEQQLRGLARAYTDVASVKSAPGRDVLSAIADPATFIGGHPLAGRERAGPLAARADLFEGRTWVLTPTAATARPVLNRALEMICLCGAVPVMMDSQAHDDAVALTSHAPHVVASLMAARLRGGTEEAFRLAGQGLRDTTRVAGGDPRLWTDILRANSGPLVGVLRDLHEDLSLVLASLDVLSRSGPGQGARESGRVRDLLDRGSQGLGLLREQPPGGARLRVAVEEAPGELARLLAVLDESGVTADDVSASWDHDTLTAEFAAPATAAGPLLRRLGAEGWTAGYADLATDSGVGALR
ncbi:prephenate dehydrogenase [Nocardiopsis sp. M1B1]|uniref:prephenate dehydrogenase n=1 Tax=Nocardiopsis sp. M1B1 TaxID=3450454 RepID=UPI0040394756